MATEKENGDRPGAIARLRVGDSVDGIYACTRKDRLTTRTGSSYLAIELRDRSGTIVARAFRDADLLAGMFERGELVAVKGRVERFRDQLQVDIERIARAPDANPGDFIPVAYRDLDELDGFLEHLAGELKDPGFNGLLARLLADDELRTLWRLAPCGRSGHHAYLGGMLEHTVAVATLALECCQLHPRLNRELLLSAALVHDIGKTAEFTYGAEIGLSEAGRLLGHIELGLRIIDDAAAHVPAFDDGRRLALAHCVLTHHGADGAGRGGRFGSPEALTLARINAVDAAIKGAFEQGIGLTTPSTIA